MNTDEESPESKARKLEEMNWEVRRYTANFFGQLAIGLTVTGIFVPGLQLLMKREIDGVAVWLFIGCWMVASILYLYGEHQLTKGDRS